MVPIVHEPPGRYDVIIRVARDRGQLPDPAVFAVAADQAASRRSASIISVHTADTIISVVTVTAPSHFAALAVARAVVSEALKPQAPSPAQLGSDTAGAPAADLSKGLVYHLTAWFLCQGDSPVSTSSQEEPMTTPTISPWPLVRQGDQEHPVQTLQYLLRARGHNLAVDGIFGPGTDAAVRAFQQQKGLAVDGIVGPATWLALIITVKQGSQGDAVRGVQEEFQFRNLSGDPSKGLQIDGIFGPDTDAAVRGFQQALHLDIPSVTVDGIVGPVTWQALVSGMLSF
jgi:peptidoglycan hydrolase-like protein with peptidoglycan-binding domain